jgi:hypothetical protein
VPPTATATDTPIATATNTPTATPIPSGSLTISQSWSGNSVPLNTQVIYTVTIRNDTNGPVTISSVNMNITSSGLGFGGFNLTTCDINTCSQGNPGDPIDWTGGVVLAVGDTLTIRVTGGFFGALTPPGQGCAAITGVSTTPTVPPVVSPTSPIVGPCVGVTP